MNTTRCFLGPNAQTTWHRLVEERRDEVTQDLEHEVQARKFRSLKQGRIKLQLSAILGRWTSTPASQRE